MKKFDLSSIERVSKGYLIAALEAEGFTPADAEKAVNATLEAAVTALRAGVSVSLSNIGTLRPAVQAATTRRNPSTGETFHAPATMTVRWKVSPTLTAVLNGQSTRTSLAVKAPKR